MLGFWAFTVCRGPWVQTLVEKIRSCKKHDVAKKERKKEHDALVCVDSIRKWTYADLLLGTLVWRGQARFREPSKTEQDPLCPSASSIQAD